MGHVACYISHDMTGGTSHMCHMSHDTCDTCYISHDMTGVTSHMCHMSHDSCHITHVTSHMKIVEDGGSGSRRALAMPCSPGQANQKQCYIFERVLLGF